MKKLIRRMDIKNERSFGAQESEVFRGNGKIETEEEKI